MAAKSVSRELLAAEEEITRIWDGDGVSSMKDQEEARWLRRLQDCDGRRGLKRKTELLSGPETPPKRAKALGPCVSRTNIQGLPSPPSERDTEASRNPAPSPCLREHAPLKRIELPPPAARVGPSTPPSSEQAMSTPPTERRLPSPEPCFWHLVPPHTVRVRHLLRLPNETRLSSLEALIRAAGWTDKGSPRANPSRRSGVVFVARGHPFLENLPSYLSSWSRPEDVAPCYVYDADVILLPRVVPIDSYFIQMF
jgi:hypothetical protein